MDANVYIVLKTDRNSSSKLMEFWILCEKGIRFGTLNVEIDVDKYCDEY